MIKVNAKLQHPSPDRTTNGPDTSGIKVWVTPLGKVPRPEEVLVGGGGNTEEVVEKGSHKYELEPRETQTVRREHFCPIWLRICLCIYTHILSRYLCCSLLNV